MRRKLHTHVSRKRKRSFWHLLVSSLAFMVMMMMIDVCYRFVNVPVGRRKIVVCCFNDNKENTGPVRETMWQCVCVCVCVHLSEWMGESTFMFLDFCSCLNEQETDRPDWEKDIFRLIHTGEKRARERLFPKSIDRGLVRCNEAELEAGSMPFD